jgi:predicted ribosomally synthesized peptide with nif11-like leader
MSIQNVKAFYEKLSQDAVFRSQIKNVRSKEECSQIVKGAGYNFTQQEFEDYTAHLLEGSSSDQGIQPLNTKELEAVVGGIQGIIGYPPILMMYGVVPPQIDPVLINTPVEPYRGRPPGGLMNQP